MIDALPDLPMPGLPSAAMYNDSPFTDDYRTSQFTFDNKRFHVSWSMLTDRESLLRQDTAAASFRLAKLGAADLWAGLKYSGRIGGQAIQEAWHTVQGAAWYPTDYVEDHRTAPFVGLTWNPNPLQARVFASPDVLAASLAAVYQGTSLGAFAGWEQSRVIQKADTVTRETLKSENGPYMGAEWLGFHWSMSMRINLHRIYWKLSYEW